MILRELTLNNFCLYRGEHVLNAVRQLALLANKRCLTVFAKPRITGALESDGAHCPLGNGTMRLRNG